MIASSITAAYAADAADNVQSQGTNVGQYFTVENQTNMPLRLKINAIGSWPEVSAAIPAKGKTDRIYIESGSHPIVGPIPYLKTPFYIGTEDSSQVYVKGYLVFHDTSLFSKHSYLDKVTAANNWNIDTSFSCRAEGSKSFENKIIIKETGDLASISNSPPDEHAISCHYVKNSQVDIDKGTYDVTCSDGASSSFYQLNDRFRQKNTSKEVPGAKLANLAAIFQELSKNPDYKGHEKELIKASLDDQIGNYYCVQRDPDSDFLLLENIPLHSSMDAGEYCFLESERYF